MLVLWTSGEGVKTAAGVPGRVRRSPWVTVFNATWLTGIESVAERGSVGSNPLDANQHWV